MSRMSESVFLSSDGQTQLYFREYFPNGEARAVVQLVHGIAEHIARYDDFARFLADNGFIVVGHDQLGHGRSIADENRRGFFHENHGWDKAVEDIHILHDRTAARYPGKPYFLLGHSMGSFLVRTYLIRFHSGLDGAVISGTGQQSPALIAGGLAMCSAVIRRYGAAYPSKFLNNMAFGAYNNNFKPSRTAYDWLSRDNAAVDAYAEDPDCGFVPTAGLLRDMMGGIGFISRQKNMERMKKELPVLFFSGAMDPVGEESRGVIRAYKGFLRAGMRDVTMKIYPDGRHEMLNELNREEVYRDVLQWLSTKLGS